MNTTFVGCSLYPVTIVVTLHVFTNTDLGVLRIVGSELLFGFSFACMGCLSGLIWACLELWILSCYSVLYQ